MSPDQASMFNSAMGEFLSRHPDHTYTQTTYPDRPEVLFGLQKRLPAGQRQQDGSRWMKLGEITRTQATIIATTSQNIPEMVERIRMLIIDGRDTTQISRPVQTGGDLFTMDQVKDIVRQALIEAQKQREAIPDERKRTDEVIDEVTGPKPEIDEAPSGIRMKKRKSVKEYQKANDAKMKLWTDRAELMQMGPPIIRQRDGHIDGRWLRRAEKAWDDYLSKHPEPVA